MFKKNRKAVNLIELTLVFGLMGILLTTLAKSYTDMSQVQNARSIAIRQTQTVNAARAYINANMNDLVARTQGGEVIAIPVGRKSADELPPAGSLQELGFVMPGVIDVNSYGQHSILLIKQGEIDGTVQAVVANYGGREANDFVLGLATNFIGTSGGMIQQNPPGGNANTIYGYRGGWRLDKNEFVTDTFELPYGYNVSYVEGSTGETIGNFLWRTDTGNPEANRMHTDIDMSGNSLNSVKSISAENEVLNLLAKIDPKLIVAPENSVPGEEIDPSTYMDASGERYKNYIRPDGYTKLAYLDPSAIISHSDDTIGKSYPQGTRLADALPNLVTHSSYYAEDNTVVPKPNCGGPTSGENFKLARIYAMPISSFDIVGPGATTSGRVNFTPVNVVQDVTVSSNAGNTTINVAKTQINSINSDNSIELETAIDTMASAYGIYAIDMPDEKAWLFRYTKKNWVYESSENGNQGNIRDAPIDSKNTDDGQPRYKNMAMIQTSCYYGN